MSVTVTCWYMYSGPFFPVVDFEMVTSCKEKLAFASIGSNLTPQRQP